MLILPMQSAVFHEFTTKIGYTTPAFIRGWQITNGLNIEYEIRVKITTKRKNFGIKEPVKELLLRYVAMAQEMLPTSGHTFQLLGGVWQEDRNPVGADGIFPAVDILRTRQYVFDKTTDDKGVVSSFDINVITSFQGYATSRGMQDLTGTHVATFRKTLKDVLLVSHQMQGSDIPVGMTPAVICVNSFRFDDDLTARVEIVERVKRERVHRVIPWAHSTTRQKMH